MKDRVSETRKVADSMGELEVPKNVLYGAQTQRAINNFPVSGRRMPLEFIKALIIIKKIAARTNAKLKCIDQEIADGIVKACDKLIADANIHKNFPVDVFQTGSGTSSNMNANEVIAMLASEFSKLIVNPNDHVNFGQSSNDVIPTAIHVSAAIALKDNLIPAIEHLISTIDKKASTLSTITKTGRTHLMDAMPVTLGQTTAAWGQQIQASLNQIKAIQKDIQTLALGGTAVGTGINTHPNFAEEAIKELNQITTVEFTNPKSFFPLMSSQDIAVSLSGALKTLSVSLMKVSNDLRWMNSGPLAGLGEITLEALQPGSSIMPGKVNPVIPESTAMVCAEVIGNDMTITVAGQSGNFELNVMLPIIAEKLLCSLNILSTSSRLLADKAIKTFTVNNSNLEVPLHRNPILVTALNPIIGYEKAAQIAKEAYRENQPILDVAQKYCDLSREELVKLLDPLKLTKGGL
ncbi:MAG: class II fumarate hydratase [Pseudomonadota bacterium]|nr:class II fumarate hydratase [Pseudomonadota bacterium]